MNALTPFRTRMTPWAELEGMQDRMNRIFGLMPTLSTEESIEWAPVVNLVERDDGFVLTAELPGMTVEDIEVDIDDNVLTLRGEKLVEKEEKKEKNGRWHLKERSYGSFQRSFTLPKSVTADGVKADFAEGVLTVKIPKRADVKSHRVEIKKG